MTIRHLRIFVTVCQCGSITAAARQLYIAQPSVSLAIGELERHYKVRLFDRISRRLHITEEGRRLYAYASNIVSLYGEMEDRMSDKALDGRVLTGCTITIGNRILPGLVRRFNQHHPHVGVRAFIGNSDGVERRVLEGDLDIGLIEGVAHQSQLQAEVFLEDQLVLLCGEGHPLWAREEVRPEELMQYDLLLREKGSGTRELFDSAMLTRELVADPKWESVSTHALLEAVAQGLGVSVLPYRLAEPDLASGRLRRVRIADMDLRRKFYIITHKSKYLPEEAQAFLEEVRGTAAHIPPIPAE